MCVLVLQQAMIVRMGMGDDMRVDGTAVAVREDMLVVMRVVPDERVDDNQRRPRGHYS